ncbi:translesion error-prone DNA polymerase V autoproteolytic subunit [Yersinia enterocolitica]|uniref:LexA family protein n=1 Tax=Yersinia TaxID=629 RepID=UPI0005DE1F5D|nr:MULTISPECIES: translesion error-prone DNA polymerase V autoproteolytic subunit [Yersinia]MCW6576450.1 translesion error-prone DNA polymerase V autoproteolytic subunit [Yersinia ruckeri]CQH79309.1 mutagenesis and repair protein MucA [Yersinia enterocolitica]HDW7092385.1 translesion error-prone DNA polymerase V autoproteolytic subunit [Yersinia enterocolitica]HEB0973518.1 translesion error-prone DNA polymerase V autoproteolytic subunit [Yersinia enterocolitica]HEB1850514.1 translesion error-p
MAHLQLIPRPSDRVLASPLFSETVAAGFPSPAAGYEENELNLHEYCVKHPAATYFLRVSGSSMVDARIHDGDVLVVDRSLTPEHGSIVIASIDNEFTVKRLILRPKPCLMPMNSEFSPIYFDPDSLQIWGVVTFSIMKQ